MLEGERMCVLGILKPGVGATSIMDRKSESYAVV